MNTLISNIAVIYIYIHIFLYNLLKYMEISTGIDILLNKLTPSAPILLPPL